MTSQHTAAQQGQMGENTKILNRTALGGQVVLTSPAPGKSLWSGPSLEDLAQYRLMLGDLSLASSYPMPAKLLYSAVEW